MASLIFIPEKYRSIPKDELVDAFMGTYYENALALPDEKFRNEVLGFLKKQVASYDGSNELIWKCLWLDFMTFFMNLAGFTFFESVTRREKAYLEDQPNRVFLELLDTLNMSAYYLSVDNHAIFTTKRLVEAISGPISDAPTDIELLVLSLKDKIIAMFDNNRSLFHFQNSYLNQNRYFNPTEAMFDLFIDASTEDQFSESVFNAVLGCIITNADDSAIRKMTGEIFDLLKKEGWTDEQH